MIRWRRRQSPDAAALALAAADALFATGQELDAIALLTDANSESRDPRLELRLIDMRAEAFRRMDWSQAQTNAPTAGEDLFPGAVIPEIGRADLDVTRVRSAIMHHGCLLVRGLIDEARVARLTDDIDRAFGAFDAHKAGTELDAVAPDFVPFVDDPKMVERGFRRKGGGVLAVDSPPALFDAIAAFEAVGVGRVVRDYFGEPPALLAKKWTLRRIDHAAPPSDWHQDGAFMGGDIRSLNVWLSLSHCGDDAPGLDIVARRLEEIVPTGTDGAILNWTVGQGMVDRVAQGTVTRPVFEPGDALIFDHMNLHRTAVDPGMTRDRYAIEAWFLAPSTYETMISDTREGVPPPDQLPLVY